MYKLTKHIIQVTNLWTVKNIAVMSYMPFPDYSPITRIRAFFILHGNQHNFFVSVDVGYVHVTNSVSGRCMPNFQCNVITSLKSILFYLKVSFDTDLG